MRHGTAGEIGFGDQELADGTWRVPGRSRHGHGMDPANKKLALIAAGVGGIVLLSVGVWSAMGHRNAVVPVIQADSRPIRVKPENPGGLQINGTNDEILSGDASPASSRMVAAAEAPAPNALRARQQERPAAQMASLPTTIPPVADPSAVNPRFDALPPMSGLSEKTPVPVKPTVTLPAATQQGNAKATLVQFAALGSEAAAHAEWVSLTKRYPDLLGNHQPSFSKIERDGKMFWRIRTGGFVDMAQATGFCERARAKGAACSIASF